MAILDGCGQGSSMAGSELNVHQDFWSAGCLPIEINPIAEMEILIKILSKSATFVQNWVACPASIQTQAITLAGLAGYKSGQEFAGRARILCECRVIRCRRKG